MDKLGGIVYSIVNTGERACRLVQTRERGKVMYEHIDELSRKWSSVTSSSFNVTIGEGKAVSWLEERNAQYARNVEEATHWFKSEDGCRGYRFLPDNRAVCVFQDNAFYYRLCVTSKLTYGVFDNVYCYTDRDTALQEMDKWDGTEENEPDGWVKNPLTGRHRPDGDKSKEWVGP